MTQLEELKSLAKQVIEKNKEIKKELSESKAQIAEMSGTLTESSDKRAKLEEQLDRTNAMYGELVKEKETVESELESLNKTYNELVEELGSRCSELTDTQEYLEELKSLVSKQETTIDSLSAQLSSTDDTLPKKYDSLLKEHESAEKAIVTLNSMLKDYRTNVGSLKDEIKSHLEVESQLRDESSDSYDWKKQLDQIKREYQSFSEQHNKEVSGLRLQLDQQLTLASQATRRGDNLAKDLETLHKQFNELSIENSKLKRDRYVGNVEDIKVAFTKDWINKSFQTINGEVVYMPSEEFAKAENDRIMSSMIGIKVDGESLFSLDGHTLKSNLTLPETISTLQAMID